MLYKNANTTNMNKDALATKTKVIRATNNTLPNNNHQLNNNIHSIIQTKLNMLR